MKIISHINLTKNQEKLKFFLMKIISHINLTKNQEKLNLLNKLENDTRVDKKLYNHFYSTLKNKKKLSFKTPTTSIIDQQDGNGI